MERSAYPLPQYIPSLDGLRAVSFFIVFLAHAGVPYFPGGFGVTVFFYLSGFLITTLMRVEHEKTGTVNLRHFYLRRVLRILPPFYLILALACGLTLAGMLAGALSIDAIAAQAFHISNYWFIWQGVDGAPRGTVPYWSLAVEEHFYLLFPLLYLGLCRAMKRGGQANSILVLCGLICVWRLMLVSSGVGEDRTYMGSDTRFDSILFGCALAIGLNPVLDRPVGSERLWKWVLLPAGLALLTITFLYRADWFRETIRYTLQGIALTPIFVTAMRFSTWLPFRILNAKPIAFIGVLSYSLYLLHQVILYSLDYMYPWHTPVQRGILALGISIGAAVVIHYGIEKPAARVRKRLAHRAGLGA